MRPVCTGRDGDVMVADPPLVTVLTPVYNGAKYLSECIESVLNQDYPNWEYIIVNNVSTDSSLEIATRYAHEDQRIRIFNNTHFVGVIENHNIAFNLISPESRYCKVVSADDYIARDCLSKMVVLAESHPTVGIVGSYQKKNQEVQWTGLAQDVKVISGREVCRLTFMTDLGVFGNPTSSLYRSDLIRESDPFFPHMRPYADTSAFYQYLQNSDFGFVHEVLSIERCHDEQVSKKSNQRDEKAVAFLDILLEYGPQYLSEGEFGVAINRFLENYYEHLGRCVVKGRGREFWKYHACRMRELGYPISWRRVMGSTAYKILDGIKHPQIALKKMFIVLQERYCDVFGKKP
jgi:glycosyltransferase involved in cell wall biosynthesis